MKDERQSKVDLLERDGDALFDFVDANKQSPQKSAARNILQDDFYVRAQEPVKSFEQEQGDLGFKTDYPQHKLNKVYNQIDLNNYAESLTRKPKMRHDPQVAEEVRQVKRKISFDTVLAAQDNDSPELEIMTYGKPKTKKNFSLFKGSKVFLAAGACILALFGGLLIYNSVIIGQYSGRLEATQEALIEQQDSLEGVMQEYYTQTGDGAVNQNAQDLGLTPNQNGNATRINIKPPRQEVTYVIETNFFDKICNFIASLFGR